MDIQGMNADQITKLAEDLAAKAIEIRKAEQKAERERQRAARAAEAAEHYARTFDVIGRFAGLNEAQHGLVYAMAYEQGHASGYEEVESYYEDLAELARKIIDAA